MEEVQPELQPQPEPQTQHQDDSGSTMSPEASKRLEDAILDSDLTEKELINAAVRRTMRAALILNLAEALFPADQLWVLYLVLVNAFADFDNPMYTMAFFSTALAWWTQWPMAAYGHLAIVDTVWHWNRETKAPRFLLKPFFIWMVCLHLVGTQYQSLVPFVKDFLGPDIKLNLALLPLVPGFQWRWDIVTTINAFVPEDFGGVPMAVIFRMCQIVFPKTLQWLFFLAISFPDLQPNPYPIEWAYCSLLWWYFDTPIDIAYGLSLANNQILHANTLFRNNGGDASILLLSERLGAFFFAFTCLILRLAQWSLGWNLAIHMDSPSLSLKVFWAVVVISPILLFVALRIYYRSKRRYGTSKFQHQKLEGRNSIRLLRVHPKPIFGNHLISCDMIHTKLDHTPRYTAVSYTWGNAGHNEQIVIDGQIYTVSPNVYSILQETRSLWSSQLLWIDSICINQMDNDDKTTQVGLMRRIFEEASLTIAWLGDYPNPKPCFDLIRDISSWTSIPNIGEVMGETYGTAWTELCVLLSNQWFERIWIVQEIAVASQPELRYGTEQVPWDIFAHAIKNLSLSGFRDGFFSPQLNKNMSANMHGFENALIMENIRLCYRNSDYLSMKDTLKLGLRFNSTLPIDKVYGLLGIVMEKNTPPIHADHSRGSGPNRDEADERRADIWIEASNVLKETNVLLGFASGRATRFTRAGHELKRTTTFGLKNLTRVMNDFSRVTQRLKQYGGQTSELDPANYSESVTAESVYTHATRAMIEDGNVFSFLQHAGIGQPRNLNGLPTWVPDWSGNLTTCSLPYSEIPYPKAVPRKAEQGQSEQEESKNEEPSDEVVFEGGGKVLRIRGVHVDAIAHIFDLCASAPEALGEDLVSQAFNFFDDRGAKYQTAIDQATKHARSPYPTTDSIEDAFWKTMIADTGVSSYSSSLIAQHRCRWVEGTDPTCPMKSLSRQPIASRSEPAVQKASEVYLCRNVISDSASVKFAHLLANEISPSFSSYRWKSATGKNGPKYLFDESKDYLPDYYHLMVDYAIGRRFAISRSGWMGLVPEKAEIGDAVVVLRDAVNERRFILRTDERGLSGDKEKEVEDNGQHNDGTKHAEEFSGNRHHQGHVEEDLESNNKSRQAPKGTLEARPWQLVGEAYFHGLLPHKTGTTLPTAKHTDLGEGRVFKIR